MFKQFQSARIVILPAILFIFNNTTVKAQDKAATLHQLNTLLINTVMVDFFTPPVASRIYSYPNIAFYECIRQDDPALPSLAGKLNGLKNIPQLPANKKTDPFIAACISFTYVAQNLVGSEYKIVDWRTAFTDSLLTNSDSIIAKNSIQYGHRVADSIIAWTKKTIT